MIVKERTGERHRWPGPVSPPFRAVARTAGGSVLPGLLVILAAAALTELLLVRTFYRVGIYIPKDGPFRNVYSALTTVGSFAFNLSSVLAVLATALVAWRAARAGARGPAAALAAFTISVLAANLAGTRTAGPLVLALFVTAVLLVAWPFVRSAGPLPQRVAVGAASAALLLSSYSHLSEQAALAVPRLPDLAGQALAQILGEAAVVIAALAFALAWARERPVRATVVVAGAVPALALVAAWRANGAVTGILVLWTAGLRLYLPFWVYVIALWALASAAIGWRGERPWRSVGLVLLLAAGLLLDSTYQLALALLGLVLLTDGLALGGMTWDTAARRSGGHPSVTPPAATPSG